MEMLLHLPVNYRENDLFKLYDARAHRLRVFPASENSFFALKNNNRSNMSNNVNGILLFSEISFSNLNINFLFICFH